MTKYNICYLFGHCTNTFFLDTVSKKSSEPKVQTNPPSVAIVDLYPNGGFPVGELQDYKTDADG